VATVSANGVVTAKAEGAAVITVTTASGNKTDTIEITAIPPVFNGTVSGEITTSETDVVTGTLTGDYSLTISGQITADYDADRIATFKGTVSGDIEGDITARVHDQGIDTLYGTITDTGATEAVRIVGIFGQTGTEGDFEGEIITGDELSPVNTLEIIDDDVVAVGNTITLSANITPDGTTDTVNWSVYVGHHDIATIDKETGVLTGVSAGEATVIVTTYDDRNLKFTKKIITVVDGDVINVTQKKGYDTIQEAIDKAEENDTILVYPGTYEESVTVNVDGLILKSVEEHAATIDAFGEDYAIDIKADNVTINSLKIIGATIRGINVYKGSFIIFFEV